MGKYSDHIVEDAIELHTDAGVKLVGVPGDCSVSRVGAMLYQVMDVLGYDPIKAQHGGMWAFAPRVYEDEVADNPFEEMADSPLERLCLIPGTRVTAIGGDTDGYYFAHIHDYTSGIEYEATFRERGYRLRPAGGE